MLIIVDKLIEGFQLKFKSWQISQKRLCESEREAIYEIHENLSEKVQNQDIKKLDSECLSRSIVMRDLSSDILTSQMVTKTTVTESVNLTLLNSKFS